MSNAVNYLDIGNLKYKLIVTNTIVGGNKVDFESDILAKTKK